MRSHVLVFMSIIGLGMLGFSTRATEAYNAGPGSILVDYWRGIGGGAVADLTHSPDFPDQPDDFTFVTTFEIASNQDDNFGTRVCGYVVPPETGNYTFWIAADDSGELWLSSSDNPKDKQKIAFVTEWTGSRDWDHVPSQKSKAITLEKGKRYFIEALHKESAGGDNLAVGWQLPNGTQERPIPGNRLAPLPPPKLSVQSVSIKIETPPPAKPGAHSITGKYVYKGKEFPFGAVLYLQEGYFTSKERYPTITSLHNVVDAMGGTTGDQGIMYEGMGLLVHKDIGTDDRHSGVWPKVRFNPHKEAKFIGILPQCPKDRAFQALPMSAVVVELVNWVDKNYRTDPDRAYLTGFSYGGSCTWAVAQSFPERFAAIMPLSALLAPNAEKSPEILKHVGVWCGVGQGDGDFVESCSKMAAIYTAAKHPNFHFTLVKDGGHHCYQAIYGDPEFWKWLLAQKRKKG
ncbi:MAG: PA14 domain-containing protein [Planctomycetota bacterium]